ncbi:hypothetical protein ASE01_01865 [Nocardioides sp. Root190]|uniref:hypothetical protein n=1 Tax=Nocardioides sp. Root190 TaxID=1736488 RepID=UPI0006F3100C|nr:hypothetical protein [Nocardioides sp. Root190]KRB80262.1 hypothetical protein ASE01_01865 [Nocardioides sp. Root190]
MVNDVRELMHQAVATPPDDHTDLGAVLAGGRRAVRRRRRTVAVGLAAAVVVTATAGALSLGGGADPDRVASTVVPRPDGPVVRLGDASTGVAGTDYDVVSSYVNEDLDAANGQYYDGVTEDGLILFRDGPQGPENTVRYALLDPETGDKDWLPAIGATEQVWPVVLDEDRLALASVVPGASAEDFAGRLQVHVFDRAARTWSTRTWSALPDVDNPWSVERGPDGRLYVGVPGTRGGAVADARPTGPDGEVDDAGAEGDTHDLWSVSLDDPSDVRDERLRFGEVAFTDDLMVWSAAANGTNERIHVRDLATGAERDFDPRSGERCNLLGFDVSGERIVLSQYCGTYDDGRDDRIQVLTTDGEPVTTIQGDGIGGSVSGDLVQVTSYARDLAGTFVYELGTGRFVRVTEATSSWSLGGPVPDGMLLWDTPVGTASGPEEPIPGATQWLVRWR